MNRKQNKTLFFPLLCRIFYKCTSNINFELSDFNHKILTQFSLNLQFLSTISLPTVNIQYSLFEWNWEPWKGRQAEVTITHMDTINICEWKSEKHRLSCIVWRIHLCIAKGIFQMTITPAWVGLVRGYVKHPRPVWQCLHSHAILNNFSNFTQ